MDPPGLRHTRSNDGSLVPVPGSARKRFQDLFPFVALEASN